MLAKLCVLILALGVCGGALLQLRQARLQVVHELARVQLRMNERDRDLLRIRTRLAQRTSPQSVEQLAAQFGPLTPLGVHLADDLAVAPDAESPRPPSVRPASHIENHAQADER